MKAEEFNQLEIPSEEIDKLFDQIKQFQFE